MRDNAAYSSGPRRERITLTIQAEDTDGLYMRQTIGSVLAEHSPTGTPIDVSLSGVGIHVEFSDDDGGHRVVLPYGAIAIAVAAHFGYPKAKEAPDAE